MSEFYPVYMIDKSHSDFNRVYFKGAKPLGYVTVAKSFEIHLKDLVRIRRGRLEVK